MEAVAPNFKYKVAVESLKNVAFLRVAAEASTATEEADADTFARVAEALFEIVTL